MLYWLLVSMDIKATATSHWLVHQSCHCHCPNRLSLSMGLQGLAAGANPSLVSWRGQGTPWTSRQFITGPLLMSNVGFSILLKDTSTCSSALPGAGIWTSDLPITSRPALPAELQPPHDPPSGIKSCYRLMNVLFTVYGHHFSVCDSAKKALEPEWWFLFYFNNIFQYDQYTLRYLNK